MFTLNLLGQTSTDSHGIIYPWIFEEKSAYIQSGITFNNNFIKW